jgi:hypothetical protein
MVYRLAIDQSTLDTALPDEPHATGQLRRMNSAGFPSILPNPSRAVNAAIFGHGCPETSFQKLKDMLHLTNLQLDRAAADARLYAHNLRPGDLNRLRDAVSSYERTKAMQSMIVYRLDLMRQGRP